MYEIIDYLKAFDKNCKYTITELEKENFTKNKQVNKLNKEIETLKEKINLLEKDKKTLMETNYNLIISCKK